MTNFEELKKRSNEIREERKKITASLKGSVFLFRDKERGVCVIAINLSDGLRSIKFSSKKSVVFFSNSEYTEDDFKLFLKIVDGEIMEKDKNDDEE